MPLVLTITTSMAVKAANHSTPHGPDQPHRCFGACVSLEVAKPSIATLGALDDLHFDID